MSLKDQAVQLAECGYAIVPVSVSRTYEGKKVVRYPVIDDVAWSVNNASLNPEVVASMPWEEPFTDIMMNLERSSVLVFDLDADKAFREVPGAEGIEYALRGDDLLYEFQTDYGLPTHFHAKSHSGDGRHVFFAAPADVSLKSSTKKLGDYVDIKATGALIVGEPDKLPETFLLPTLPYEFARKLAPTKEERPLSTAPSAPKYLKGEEGTPYGLAAREKELRSIDDEWQEDRGNFNHQLYVSSRSLGELVAGGELHETTTYQKLTDLLTELSAPSDQFKTLDSGFYTGLKEPRNSDTVESEDPVEQAKVSEDRVDALRAQLKTAEEMMNLPEPEWLIEGWLVKSGLTHIIGEGKIGKTFIAHDMAACLASGLSWPEHEPVNEQYKVLYIAGEGAYGLGQRIGAWVKHWERNTCITYLPRPIHVMRKEGRDLRKSDEWRTMEKIIKEDRYDLILLDTQQRMTVGVAENDATEMGQLVDTLEEITRETDACLALLHHVNKGETASARGSSVLAGSVNTEIKLTGRREDGYIRVANTLQKDGPMADPVFFQLTEVEGTSSVVPILTEEDEEETEEQPSRRARGSIEQEDRRIRIMNLFEMHPGEPQTFGQIRSATGIAKQTLSKDLAKLVEGDVLSRRGEGSRSTWQQP